MGHFVRRSYTGFTEDLDRRIAEHMRGHVISTRNRRPLKLVYFEEFQDKSA